METLLEFPPRAAPGLPHPQSPAGSGWESFCDRAELARRPAPRPGSPPSSTPRLPGPTLPGGRGEDAEGRRQPLPGTRHPPGAGAVFGANSSPRRGAGGGGRDSEPGARGAGAGPSPGRGWRSSGGGEGSAVCLSRAGAEPAELARRSPSPWPLPALGSPVGEGGPAPASRRDITSIQARIGRPQRQVCAIGLHSNKARPALLPRPPPRRTSRLRRVAPSGRGGRSEFVPEPAGGLLLFAATPPHAGARTLTRAHFLDSAFSPESGLGFSPAHLAGRHFLPARPSACARGPLGASLCGGHLAFVTFVLALPGDTRRTHTVPCSVLERGTLLRHKVRLCHPCGAPSPPRACTRGHTAHRVPASCTHGPSPAPRPPSVRGNATGGAPNAAGRARNHLGARGNVAPGRLPRAWVSCDRPRVGPTPRALPSARLRPCSDLS